MTYGEHLIRGYYGEQNAIPPWLRQATAQRHAPPPDTRFDILIPGETLPLHADTTTGDTRSYGQLPSVDPQKYPAHFRQMITFGLVLWARMYGGLILPSTGTEVLRTPGSIQFANSPSQQFWQC